MNLRRADAEVIRDSVLSASGKLDLTFGGPTTAMLTVAGVEFNAPSLAT